MNDCQSLKALSPSSYLLLLPHPPLCLSLSLACPCRESCPLGSALEGEAVISNRAGADFQAQTAFGLEKAVRAKVGDFIFPPLLLPDDILSDLVLDLTAAKLTPLQTKPSHMLATVHKIVDIQITLPNHSQQLNGCLLSA